MLSTDSPLRGQQSACWLAGAGGPS